MSETKTILIVWADYGLDCCHEVFRGIYDNKEALLKDFPRIDDPYGYNDLRIEEVKINKRYNE